MNINHQLIQKTIQLILTPQHSDNEITKQVVGHLKSIPGIKVFGRNAMEEFLKTHNIAGLQQMVDNNSQINKKDNDKNGKQDSSKAKGLSLQRLLLAKRSKSERSILEAANLFQGRSNGAYENSKGRIGEENGGREETEREKQKRLEDWARENNLWIDNLDNTLETNFGHSINSGGEATVYLGEDGTVVKSISLDYYNGDPQKALDRILLHNYLFGDITKLSDIGFGRDSDGTFKIIVAQPYINGTFATHEEILDYAKKRGFITEDGNTYYKGIKINDLNPLNVLKTPNEGYAVVDAELRFTHYAGGFHRQ